MSLWDLILILLGYFQTMWFCHEVLRYVPFYVNPTGNHRCSRILTEQESISCEDLRKLCWVSTCNRLKNGAHLPRTHNAHAWWADSILSPREPGCESHSTQWLKGCFFPRASQLVWTRTWFGGHREVQTGPALRRYLGLTLMISSGISPWCSLPYNFLFSRIYERS